MTRTFVLGRAKGSLCLPFFDLIGSSAAEGSSPSKTSGSTSRAAGFPFAFLLAIGFSLEVGGVGDERECGVVMGCRTGEAEDELLCSSPPESERTRFVALRARWRTGGDPYKCSGEDVA